MLISHRFGSVETLSRAQYWMARLGFEIARPNSESHDVSRLSLNIDFSRSAAAMALIDSIEASDPDGWPGFMAPSRPFPSAHDARSDDSTQELAAPARTPIHWHRRDDAASANPETSKIVEYMLSRGE